MKGVLDCGIKRDPKLVCKKSKTEDVRHRLLAHPDIITSRHMCLCLMSGMDHHLLLMLDFHLHPMSCRPSSHYRRHVPTMHCREESHP